MTKITKQHLCVINYILKKKSVHYSSLVKKFAHKINLDDILKELIHNGYVEQLGGHIDKYGDPIPFQSETLFKLNNLGISEVESHQWFDFQYVLTNIMVPIIVGIFSSLITALIMLLI